MTYEYFSVRAEAIYAEIPPAYREGVDGLEVSRRTVLHPTLPEIYTLGECLSEHYPSDFGGAGEVRSIIHLYYGSFLELSRSDEDWDWEEELFETITHELRHHLEHLALDDSLGELDLVEEENFARREGRSHDPFFFRGGRRIASDLYEVDGDLFFDRPLAAGESGSRAVEVALPSGRLRVGIPEEAADVYFLSVDPSPLSSAGEFHIVLSRPRGVMGKLRDMIAARAPLVLHDAAKPIDR